ncbi:pentapeptide repeat-containing protein [Glycomyces sp. NPDC047369]
MLTVLSYFFFTWPIPEHPPSTAGLGPQEAASQNATAELELARMRAQAHRNTAATAAGFAAIGALLLAIRRQSHHEAATEAAQNAEARRQDQLERKAADEKHDAEQRRITDARVRAVEQLGSGNAAVRISGLYNLERIAQLHKDLRQIVLDEICSYLRLPLTPPGVTPTQESPDSPAWPAAPPAESDDEGATGDGGAEREVRLIAQEILQRHLDRRDSVLYWGHTRLNLRNAHLDGIHFGGCNLVGAEFVGATFTGYTDFKGTTFTGNAMFGAARFVGRVDFTEAVFTSDAHFAHAVFTDYTYFRKATVHRDALFGSAVFTGDVHFEDVKILRDAHIAVATFERVGDFSRVNFSGVAVFSGTSFTGPALFPLATFDQGMLFGSVTFHHGPVFEGALVNQRKRSSFLPLGWELVPSTTDPGWHHLEPIHRPDEQDADVTD